MLGRSEEHLATFLNQKIRTRCFKPRHPGWPNSSMVLA